MTAERQLLKRLVALWVPPLNTNEWESVDDAIAEARALIAQPEPVMAESWVHFRTTDHEPHHEDSLWLFVTTAPSRDAAYKVRIPIPAHLLNPPVVTGEVVDGA